jgi:hypothetical protein
MIAAASGVFLNMCIPGTKWLMAARGASREWKVAISARRVYDGFGADKRRPAGIPRER